MVDPNSRNDPKLQELMKVRISKDSSGRLSPQPSGLGRSREGRCKESSVMSQSLKGTCKVKIRNSPILQVRKLSLRKPSDLFIV